MQRIFTFFAFLIFGFSFHVKAQSLDYFMIKEENVSLLDQLNSIYLDNKWNSNLLIKTVASLNGVNVKDLRSLPNYTKIKIPDPHNQKQCNFLKTKYGLVTYKYYLKTPHAKIRLKLKPEMVSCDDMTVYDYFTVRKNTTTLSSMIYSIYLKPIWGKTGMMNEVGKVNRITRMDNYNINNVFILPSFDKAVGCNYRSKDFGEIVPAKLINKKSERIEFSTEEKCPEPPPVVYAKTTEEFKSKHTIAISAVTNLKYSVSDVSEVEVDIISDYGISYRYAYFWKPKAIINFYGQFEYYSKVKNRKLGNNLAMNKTLNVEYLFDKYSGVTIGLNEPYYFDNIEVDVFNFTSSLLPYIGLTHHTNYNSTYIIHSELGIMSSIDLFSRDRVSSGMFLINNVEFSLYGYDLSLGVNISNIIYTRYVERNISLTAGLTKLFD